MIKVHAQKQGYTEAQKIQKGWIVLYKNGLQKCFFFKKNLTNFQNFGLRPYKPLVAIAVGKKTSALAIEIRITSHNQHPSDNFDKS